MRNYPVIKLSILFIIGILLQPFFSIQIVLVFIGILFFTAFLIFYFSSFNSINSIIFLLLSLLIISMGVFRVSVVEKGSFIAENLYKVKNFTASGTVTKIELKKDYEVEFYFTADSVKVNNNLIGKSIKLIGKIRDERKGERDSIYNKLLPGNIIFISGTFSKGREMRNPGEFDYNKYLRSKGISGIVTTYNVEDLKILNDKTNFFPAEIFKIRKAINRRIFELHDQQTASLLKGLLLADRSDIDYQTKTEFINAGVIHVLAVSGLHTGFIILFLLIVFGRFNLYLRSIITVLGLFLFMCITGLPVSVIRASVMAVVIIIAFIFNRTTNIYNSLALAALIILIATPFEIYSPGFQLSFSAVLSIAVIFPLCQRKIKDLHIKNSFIKYTILLFAVSFSAQIGTLPVTLIYFGKLSLIAFAANLVVIPLAGLIILIAIVTLIVSPISIFIASIYAAANDLFTSILFNLINFAGSFEYSFIWIRNFSIYDAFIFYSLLILFIHYYKKFQSASAKFSLLFLIIINFVIFSSLDSQELLKSGELNLLMIDVGQGDAFLLKMPSGKTALIDAGDASFYFDNGERVIIPLLNYLGINKIDYGFVSHLDLDHYGGFVSLIHNKRIKQIYKPALDSTDKSDEKFENYLKQNDVPFSYYKKKIIKLNNSRVYFLNDNLNGSYSKNNRSGIIKIIFGNDNFLFTGDAELRREKILLQDYKSFLRSDVLKVGHHGSSTGSSLNFLETVKPEYSLISAGIKNKFRHPSPEVLNRLGLIKSKIFRTDKLGAVLLRSNGDSVYVVDWKNY
jgi:competence protein ComEC